jgi:hypothetical protein
MDYYYYYYFVLDSLNELLTVDRQWVYKWNEAAWLKHKYSNNEENKVQYFKLFRKKI